MKSAGSPAMIVIGPSPETVLLELPLLSLTSSIWRSGDALTARQLCGPRSVPASLEDSDSDPTQVLLLVGVGLPIRPPPPT